MSDAADGKLSNWRQRLGRWGEDTAASYLESVGHQIMARNWRGKSGEVDLITRHDEVIVFVEVKTRRGSAYGLPEEALTPLKASRLMETAELYLSENDLSDVEWRIDLVAIEVDGTGRLIRCEHIPHAVLGW